jgi:DNA-binding transcriptional regulator YiaG
MRTGARLAHPEWARKIQDLRRKLGLSQTALAELLRVSAMAVSRWERGINEPPGGAYIALGKLAGAPDCWYFWERTGLKKSDLAKALGRNSP